MVGSRSPATWRSRRAEIVLLLRVRLFLSDAPVGARPPPTRLNEIHNSTAERALAGSRPRTSPCQLETKVPHRRPARRPKSSNTRTPLLYMLRGHMRLATRIGLVRPVCRLGNRELVARRGRQLLN